MDKSKSTAKILIVIFSLITVFLLYKLFAVQTSLKQTINLLQKAESKLNQATSILHNTESKINTLQISLNHFRNEVEIHDHSAKQIEITHTHNRQVFEHRKDSLVLQLEALKQSLHEQGRLLNQEQSELK